MTMMKTNIIFSVCARHVPLCDVHNVPMATNIATAEVLICALDHGDLDWREIVNPRSDYNRRRRGLNY